MERIYQERKIAKEKGEPILREQSFEILLDLVRKKQFKSILEIGTNVGLTGIAMLKSCESAKLTGIEIDEEKVKIATENYKKFGVDNRAKIFIGDAGEILSQLTAKYDLIFLDGPKGHYFRYLQDLLPALNVGGILFADNVLFRGYVNSNLKTPKRYNTTKYSMQNFIKAITEDKNLRTQILDIEDGISITEKLK